MRRRKVVRCTVMDCPRARSGVRCWMVVCRIGDCSTTAHADSRRAALQLWRDHLALRHKLTQTGWL